MPRWGGLEQRFWDRVSPEPNSGCWLWTGAGSRNYGQMRAPAPAKHVTYATHIALLLAGRPQPSPTALACHRCDVSWCVNPDHLYWGTDKTNARDCVERGNFRPPPRGEKHHSAKLTEAQVRYVRLSGKSAPVLARDLGVSRDLIYLIRRRRIWRDLV